MNTTLVNAGLKIRTNTSQRLRTLRNAALAALLLLALATAVAAAVPLLAGQPPTSVAADIARSSPEVKKSLHGDVANVRVLDVLGDMATVTVEDKTGIGVTVQVDLRAKRVTRLHFGPQLSDELIQKALNIVTAYPPTQDLLVKGARVVDIRPLMVGGYKTTGEAFSETWAEVQIEGQGQTWTARVDLPRGMVEQVVQ